MGAGDSAGGRLRPLLHDRLLSNHQWLLRNEPEMGKRMEAKSRLGHAVGSSKTISQSLGTGRIAGPVRIPLAMILSGLLAFGFMFVLMQSQLKGQVLMACFVAFLGSTICAYYAFPTAPFWSFILAVPLTGRSVTCLAATV